LYKYFCIVLIFCICISCSKKPSDDSAEYTRVSFPKNEKAEAVPLPKLNNKEADYVDIYALGTIHNGGIITKVIEERPRNNIVEIKFENENHRIYYRGSAWRSDEGDEVYFIKNNDNEEQIIIDNAWVRYGPEIIWHGDIAEIYTPLSGGTRLSQFYDFRRDILSDEFSDHIYLDFEYNIIIEIGEIIHKVAEGITSEGCLIMYDIFTSEIISKFEFGVVHVEYQWEGETISGYRRLSNHPDLTVYGNFEFEKLENRSLSIKCDINREEHNFRLIKEFLYQFN
jgi:hypothetical protein